MKIKVEQVNSFKNLYKKIHLNQKKELDKAIERVKKNPHLGKMKLGNLNGLRIYKFNMIGLHCLLAFRYFEKKKIIRLIKFGSHENFYRDF